MNSEMITADFNAARERLREALTLPTDEDVVKAGCIQYFEFTFELAWKTVKLLAEEEGVIDCRSPKAALRAAFSNRWIDNEDIWLDMLAARNLMAHTYHAENALAIFSRLPEYLKAFDSLAAKLAGLRPN